MTAQEFYEKENCNSNPIYLESDVEDWFFSKEDMILFAERYHEALTVPDVSKRLLEMEEAGKKATSLIAHLKDQHGFNEVEEEAQDKIMKVFKYEGRW